MRLGCFGCFFLVVGILVLLILAGGILFLSANVFDAPIVHQASFSKSDGYSAQQKLFEIASRQSGHSSRKDAIVLSEREVNAFLTNHLAETAGVPLAPLVVKFDKGRFMAQGRTPLRNLFRVPPLSTLVSYLPASRLSEPVWVTVRGQVVIEPAIGKSGGRGEVHVAELEIGRQPVSSYLLYVMLGPSGGGLLRWPTPAVVESVQLEPGRATIRTR